MVTVTSIEKYEKLKLTITLSKENKERIEIDLKPKRELRFALTPNVFRLVRNCESAFSLWNTLKEIYGGNLKQLKSQQTAILSEFRLFKQKSTETLEQAFDRFNLLLNQLEKYDLARKPIEQKVTFLQGLKPEWKSISTTVKGHEQFESYNIQELFGVLKTHGDDVVVIEKTTPGGVNALLSKSEKKVQFVTNSTDASSESEDSDDEAEEKAFMVNNQKKFYKNKYNSIQQIQWRFGKDKR